MKAFFRFLRGELNGFYITNLHNMLNKATSSMRDFLYDFAKMQFDLQSMPAETLYNIGTFAGVHLVRLSAGETYGAFRMTEGYIVGGNERSERGLLVRDTEEFEFEHTEQDNYPTDINTLATKDKRSSLVGTEEPVGYVSSEEQNVLDEDGNIIPSAILTVPPSGVAYSEFYGNEFTFLSDQLSSSRNINPVLFIELYKVMQYIRYNGVNIKSFIQMVSILCPEGLVRISSITKRTGINVFNVLYVFDDTAPVDSQTQRLALLEYLIKLKFPQFLLMVEA